MNTFIIIASSMAPASLVGVILLHFRMNGLSSRILEIERKRTKFYKRLANPQSIEEEMEKGARLREMHDANRTTLPRDDQEGPAARVHRPKMRTKMPTGWNPPRA
jgi:hypothetical protein